MLHERSSLSLFVAEAPLQPQIRLRVNRQASRLLRD
jgi:hypothetical protein